MALSGERLLMCGVSPYPFEQKAIEDIQKLLPNVEPYRMWALVDLVDPAGRRYDLDVLVLGRHALYLIELKHYAGRITGDANDWTVESQSRSGKKSLYPNPSRLANQKARVLASLLRDRLRDRPPWVQHLIVLSNPQADIQKLDPIAHLHVIKLDGVAAALTEGKFPGADPTRTPRIIEAAQARQIQNALRELGITPSKAARQVNDLRLDRILEEGPGYQDWLASNPRLPELRRRVRTYLVPQATSQERREQLFRAAEREARVLTAIGDHRSILGVQQYIPDTELGCPCLVFEHWGDAETLAAYIRRHPGLSLESRITLVEKIGDALSYCHRKQVIHRGLHPGAVLVREDPDTKELQVWLYNFQLAARDGLTSGTVHLSALDPDEAAVYRAPEVIEDPTRASAESDIYSLGALTYFVLTGRPPGTSLKERDELLRAGNGRLSLAAVRDDLASYGFAIRTTDDKFQNLDDLLAMALAPNPMERPDSAIAWVGLLVDNITAPQPHPGQQLDPIEARPKQELAADLVVDSVLGTGSTARVLRVSRGGSHYALKVALSADHQARLREEAEILKRLKSEHIVGLVETLELGPTRRLCLLLEDAGDTLADLLVKEGPPSLDYAQRWGENLLAALEHLEDLGIQHRDIKPSNLGILAGTSKSKRARRLRLFDFSLTAVPATQVTAGTPAYRDPFMPARGHWDEAADRYAAAATLYEMLTATRVRWGKDDLPATAADQEAVLEAERFDAAARDRLLAFFRKSFAREVSQRHSSAGSMRTDWTACFAESPRAAASSPAVPAAAVSAAPPRTAAQTRSPVTYETSVSSLGLSVRALNALDRSGVITVRHLLELPRNHLSLIRGVGRGTIEELLKELRRLEPQLAERAEAPRPFFAGIYRGPDVAVSFLPDLSPTGVALLQDAGLGSLQLLAAAPRERVERVLRGQLDDLKNLLATLKTKGGKRLAEATPQTVQDWLEALVPVVPAKKRGATYLHNARRVLGLDPVAGQTLLDAQKVADALGVSRQMVHASLKQAIAGWQAHPAIGALIQAVTTALEAQGGVAAVSKLADLVTATLPHRSGTVPELAHAEVTALLRIAGMLAKPSDELILGRLHDAHWLALDRERIDQARALGERADKLAARDPLPSSDEVQERLREVVADGPLAGLAQERLVTLAAEASEHAAKSARLELYPRHLPAQRALMLAAGALAVPQIKLADVVRAVRSRYPEAAELPPQPELDALLAPLQLHWDPASNAYVRPTAAPATSSYSHLGERQTTTHSRSSVQPSKSPQVQIASAFEQRLKLFVQRRLYRVLLASTKLAEEAAAQLTHSIGVSPLSLDRALLAAAQQVMAEDQVDPTVVYAADREGPSGAEWGSLKQLMHKAARRVLTQIQAARTPQVLIHPGLLGRYELDDFLAGLLACSEQDDSPAILLLVPTLEDQGPPCIQGVGGLVLPVPTSSGAPPQSVPEPWVLNFHRGGQPDAAPLPT